MSRIKIRRTLKRTRNGRNIWVVALTRFAVHTFAAMLALGVVHGGAPAVPAFGLIETALLVGASNMLRRDR